MTFNDFINSFQTGINLILNNLGSFFSNLTSNYLVIVLLGLTLFVSFFFFFYDSLFDFIHSYITRHFSSDNDMYDNFDKFQKMKQRWYDNNMNYLYNMKYINYSVFQNVKELYKPVKVSQDINKITAFNPDYNERIYYPDEYADLYELVNKGKLDRSDIK